MFFNEIGTVGPDPEKVIELVPANNFALMKVLSLLANVTALRVNELITGWAITPVMALVWIVEVGSPATNDHSPGNTTALGANSEWLIVTFVVAPESQAPPPFMLTRRSL